MSLLGKFSSAISKTLSYYATGKRSWGDAKNILTLNNLFHSPLQTFKKFVEYRTFNRLTPKFENFDPYTVHPKSLVTPTIHRLTNRFQYVFKAKVGYLGRRGTEEITYSFLSDSLMDTSDAIQKMLDQLEDTPTGEASDKFSSIELSIIGIKESRWIK